MFVRKFVAVFYVVPKRIFFQKKSCGIIQTLTENDTFYEALYLLSSYQLACVSVRANTKPKV